MKVTLHKRVIVADGVAFDAEREIDLPLAPFVGLRLYGAQWVPKGCDPSEDPIKEVGYDLPSGKLLCYLRHDDFRPEASGSADWTEDDIREHYRDWKLTREPLGGPPVDPERNGA